MLCFHPPAAICLTYHLEVVKKCIIMEKRFTNNEGIAFFALVYALFDLARCFVEYLSSDSILVKEFL